MTALAHIPTDEITEVLELVDWLGEQTWSNFAQSLYSFSQRRGGLTTAQLSAARKMKAKCDARATEPQVPDPEPGFYFIRVGEDAEDAVFVRVQENRDKTRVYAMAFDPDTRRWEYVNREPFAACTPDTVVTAEQAMWFGHAYGICLRCGATLTDPESVARGIGPVCATKSGW